MLWRALALSSGLAVAILSAGCGGSPAAIAATPPPTVASPEASASATSSASTPVHFASRCMSSQLTLGWGGRISEPTGQHTLSLTLTNSSQAGCHLFGYPGVSFVDPGGRVLPLRYVWGGDQVVTSSKPVMVDLPAGGTAYVLVNKYRCDTTDVMQGAAVRVIPPDERALLQVSIIDNVPMDYCGPGDPGSVVYVSPVEPTFDAVFAGH